jgi:hypothetical protein
MTGPRGELGPLARLARRQGWSIVINGGQHWAWYPPGESKPVITGSSPGKGRAHANAVARLRRAGLKIPGRR